MKQFQGGVNVDDSLFKRVFKSCKQTDDFPSTPVWEKEVETWLSYIERKGWLDNRLLSRLRSQRPNERDGALNEIFSAYFLEKVLNFQIVEWEPAQFDFRLANDICCEVKGPGWEGELNEEEKLGKRKFSPKYIPGEVRSVGPWRHIRCSIKKSYPKFSPDQQNLLIIVDDLLVSILASKATAEINIHASLFNNSPKNYDGCGFFQTGEFQNIGGILFLEHHLYSEEETVRYYYWFAKNPKAINPFILENLPENCFLKFPRDNNH